MPHFTQAEVDAIEARVKAGRNRLEAVHDTVLNRKDHLIKPTEDRESVLHGRILEECKRRGWIACHGVMHKASGRTPGEPDFTIYGDNGQWWLVEVKTRTGKQTIEQAAFQCHLKKLGHHHAYHIVRSFDEFLALMPVFNG